MAGFARAPLEALLAVQGLLALAIAVLAVWLLAVDFFPTITDAVAALPDSAQILHGELSPADLPPRLLAEGRCLALVLDPKHDSQIRSPAQFQFEFGGDSLLILSLFGEVEVDYPPDQSFYFNRTDLEPKWGAWSPELLGLAGLTVFLGLLLGWNLLALFYSLPVWLIAFFANRDLGPVQSWRLAGAALMPGAALLGLAIWLYGIGAFDLVKLGFAFGMHFLIGWLYLVTSPFFLPRAVAAPGKNPFSPAA